LTKTPHFLVVKPKFWIGYTKWSRIQVCTGFKKNQISAQNPNGSLQYISFYGFQRISNFAQNPKWLTYNFTKKCQFAEKTNWNSIFLSRKAQILDQLHIMVSLPSYRKMTSSRWITCQKSILLSRETRILVW
jgi:hypothetical protein